MLYLIILQPVLLVPAAYGMIALFGYNHPRLRWAYRPYAELYLGMPVNAISVLVISFIGSGVVTLLSVAVSVVFGFASSTFFVSMMSMDYPTDGRTARSPRWYAGPGEVLHRVSHAGPRCGLRRRSRALLPGGMGSGVSGPVMCLDLHVLAAMGHRVDILRFNYLRGEVERPEGTSASIRLGQLYASVVFSIALSIVLLAGG
jgi:hypothetical protein